MARFFVQRRASSGSRWKDKRIVESSKKYMRFEYAENETGFKIEKN